MTLRKTKVKPDSTKKQKDDDHHTTKEQSNRDKAKSQEESFHISMPKVTDSPSAAEGNRILHNFAQETSKRGAEVCMAQDQLKNRSASSTVTLIGQAARVDDVGLGDKPTLADAHKQGDIFLDDTSRKHPPVTSGKTYNHPTVQSEDEHSAIGTPDFASFMVHSDQTQSDQLPNGRMEPPDSAVTIPPVSTADSQALPSKADRDDEKQPTIDEPTPLPPKSNQGFQQRTKDHEPTKPEPPTEQQPNSTPLHPSEPQATQAPASPPLPERKPIRTRFTIIKARHPRLQTLRWSNGTLSTHSVTSLFTTISHLTSRPRISRIAFKLITSSADCEDEIMAGDEEEFEAMKDYFRAQIRRDAVRNGSWDFVVEVEPDPEVVVHDARAEVEGKEGGEDIELPF